MDAILSNEIVQKLRDFIQKDPYYIAHRESFTTKNLEKLMQATGTPYNEEPILYSGGGLVVYTGSVMTCSGFYHRGVMEFPHHTTWEEFMVNPINVLIRDNYLDCVRIKKNLFHYKPFMVAIGDSADACANFWIRIKHVLAEG